MSQHFFYCDSKPFVEGCRKTETNGNAIKNNSIRFHGKINKTKDLMVFNQTKKNATIK
jgi:hypothetical protein